MKKRILVVDDDPTSLRTVEAVFSRHDFEVKTATHAQDIEGNVSNFKPDLIVMDLMMPKVDGAQAVKRLQDDPVLKNIPIVFLTAIKMKDDERGVEFEVSVEDKHYRTLTKPFNAVALITEIKELIGKK